MATKLLSWQLHLTISHKDKRISGFRNVSKEIDCHLLIHVSRPITINLHLVELSIIRTMHTCIAYWESIVLLTTHFHGIF